MKRITLYTLTVIMLLFSVTTTTKADSEKELMAVLAKNYISAEEVDDNGILVTVYTGLDSFVSAVYSQFPDIPDIDIARFVMDYTNQEMTIVTPEDVNFVLSLDNIHTYSEEVSPARDGSNVFRFIPLRDTWISTNGKMKIVTSFSYKYHNSYGDYYEIWSTATWLTVPSSMIKDVFVLGSSATFDSSFIEHGYVSMTDRCDELSCGDLSLWYRNVNANSTLNVNLSLLYTAGYPYLSFTSTGGICKTCYSSNVTRTKESTCYRYRVISDGADMIYASYGHMTFGVGSFSVSIGYNGKPSIGASLTVFYDTYDARGLSLTH